MGNVLHSRILVLGIDSAGKTTFLNKYEKPGDNIPTEPTDAYVIRDFKLKGVKFNVWDVSGKPTTRQLWKHYYAQGGTDAIIWVIDSSSSDEKIEESKTALQSALMDPNLSGVLLFVLANKQDVEGARHPDAIATALNLSAQKEKRPFHIHGISSKTGEGIPESMAHLAKEIKAIAKSKQ